MKTLLPVSHLSLTFLCSLFTLVASAAPQEPVYPPPGCVTFSQSGSPDDGTISRATGRTWYLTNVVLVASIIVYRETTINGFAMSFYEGTFSAPEFMTFNPGGSSLSSGVVVWDGQTAFAVGPTVFGRCVLAISNQAGPVAMALSNAAVLGLPNNIGAVVRVTGTNLGFLANLI